MRYDKERPWHSWADLRVQVRLLPWHWRLVPSVHGERRNIWSFEWLCLTVEYWCWDRRTQEQVAASIGSLFGGSWQVSEDPYKAAVSPSSKADQ